MDLSRPFAPRPLTRPAFIFLFCLGLSGPDLVHAQEPKGLSLDSLLNVPVKSASKHLQTVRDAPASVSIITADDIARFGWSDLSQVLNSVGGFYTSYDRNYTYIGVRGFGRPTDYNNRLLLLIDGHTINEGFWGSTTAGPDLAIDLRSLARIEVVRGPGSALYGNNAVFAIINLITKQGSEIDGVRLSGSAGSYGNRGGSVIAGTQLASGLDVIARAGYGETDGQTLHFPELEFDSATGGTIRHLDWEKRGEAFVRLEHAPSGLSLTGRYTSREKGIPTASYGQIPGDRHASTTDRSFFAELGLERGLSPALQLSLRGYADVYRYEGSYAYDPVYIESAENRIAGGEAILRWDLSPSNRATVGSEYRDNYRGHYRYPINGPAETRYGEPYHVWSLFAQYEADVTQWLTFVAGVRHDDHSRAGSHLSPRGAAVIHPDRATSVKLLYGGAFRAPSISEAKNGGVPTVDGRSPRAEEIHTLEIVFQRQVSRGTLITAGAYQYRMTDLIDQVLVEPDSVYEFRNNGRADARGAYLGLSWEGESGAEAMLNVGVTGAEDAASDDRLTNSPSVQVKAGFGLPLPEGFSVGIQSRYESGRITVTGSETDPYALADLYLHWQGRGRFSGFDAGLRLNNAFDTDWATPGGLQHLQPAIAQDGRNVLVTLGVHF